MKMLARTALAGGSTSAQALWDDTVKLYLVAKCCIIYDVQLQYRTYQQIYVCIRHPKGCTTGKQDLYLYSTKILVHVHVQYAKILVQYAKI
jgi:hypothetical protein